MENHETQEPQETKETKETPKTTSELHTKEPQKKEKNPKRVAAGKKGAEVRWSKHVLKSSPAPAESIAAKAEPAEQAAAKAEPAEPEKITKDTPFDSSHNSPHKSHNSPPQTVVNVYKNYVPLALVAGAVGVWIFAKFAKIGSNAGSGNKQSKRIAPPVQSSAQLAQPASVRRQPEIDPFEMR